MFWSRPRPIVLEGSILAPLGDEVLVLRTTAVLTAEQQERVINLLESRFPGRTSRIVVLEGGCTLSAEQVHEPGTEGGEDG